MEHEKVVKLRSRILDKLYKCDDIFQQTIKYDSIVVIDNDKINNIVTKKSIESIELCKSLTMFESDSDALKYLQSIKTPPSLILLNFNYLNFLKTYHIDSAQTKVIILKEKNTILKKNTLETIEKPLSISFLKTYFKI